MQFFLSWKQKFLMLGCIALLSLALMTAVSIWSNAQIGGAMQAQQAATNYRNVSLNLLNGWLTLEQSRNGLNSASREAFSERQQRLQAYLEQLVPRAQGLGDPEVLHSAQSITEQLQVGLALQEQWLKLREQFGLSPDQGQRKVISAAAQKLEQINISLIQPTIAQALRAQRDYLANFDPEQAKQAREAIKSLQATLAGLEWEETAIGKSATEYSRAFDDIDALVVQLRDVEARLKQASQQVQQQIETQNDLLGNGILARTAQQADQARQSSLVLLGITFVIVSIVLLSMLWRVSQQLMLQLGRVGELLTQVAAGNLSRTLEEGRNPRDEFNQLGKTSNRMIEGISTVVAQVLQGNRHLGELRDYLNEAMRRLEQNSAQVESQTEQAASASRQISLTVNEIAQRTSEVGEATRSAVESARQGSRVIDASVTSMRNLSGTIQATHEQVALLSQSSTRVSGIIDVINSLADQTNLLALNAAIEAARAGEAGRGFSVVADEVRSLAQKTVAATTDIAHIVGEFQQQTRQMDSLMERGLNLAGDSENHAGQVAEAIGVITQSMEQLNDEMNRVVVAVEEISTTTLDIAGKMDDINHHTEETRQLRQTLDEHARSLSTQVAALETSTSQFRLA